MALSLFRPPLTEEGLFDVPPAGHDVTQKWLTERFKAFLKGMEDVLPHCRETAIMMTKLEEAHYFALVANHRHGVIRPNGTEIVKPTEAREAPTGKHKVNDPRNYETEDE